MSRLVIIKAASCFLQNRINYHLFNENLGLCEALTGKCSCCMNGAMTMFCLPHVVCVLFVCFFVHVLH